MERLRPQNKRHHALWSKLSAAFLEELQETNGKARSKRIPLQKGLPSLRHQMKPPSSSTGGESRRTKSISPTELDRPPRNRWRTYLRSATEQNRVMTAGAALAAMVGLYVTFSTVRTVIKNCLAIPLWDQWDSLVLSAHDVTLGWLFAQHNEHRIFVPKLMFAVDALAFAGTNKFNCFCNVAFPAALGVLLYAVAKQDGYTRWDAKIWLLGVIFATLLSELQGNNFTWGFQLQMFLVELAAVAAFSLIARSSKSWRSVIAAIVCETIAVFSLAGGMVVPFIAPLLALWAGRNKSQVASLVAAAFVLLGIYLHGYQTPSYHSDPLQTITQIPNLANYVVFEVGNPLGLLLGKLYYKPAFAIWDAIFGIAGILLFTVAAVTTAMRGRGASSGERILLTTAGYALGVMLLTALGRLRFGAEQAVTVRYASISLLFWLAVVLLVIGQIGLRQPRRLPIAMAVVALCLTFLAKSQGYAAKDESGLAEMHRQAIAALLSGVDDRPVLGTVYPGGGVALERAPELRAHGLSIFADPWSNWLGHKLADHAVIDDARCDGAIVETVALPAKDLGGMRVSGWAWDKLHGAVPNQILLIDGQGQIVGYGFPAPRAVDNLRGWRGYVAAARVGSSDSKSILAYALLDGERTACQLGS